MIARHAPLFALGLALVATGCSSEGASSAAAPVAGQDCPAAGVTACGTTGDGAPAVLACSNVLLWTVQAECALECLVNPDTGAACNGDAPDTVGPEPSDTVTDTGADVGAEDQGRGTDENLDDTQVDTEEDLEPEEVHFVDLMPDFTPPWVKATNPSAGQMDVPLPQQGEPLEIVITFTEKMFEPTLGDKTIEVFDPAGKNMAFSWEFTGEQKDEIRLKVAGAIFPSSPYSVELSPDIRDLAGNPMGNTYQLTFYMASSGMQQVYRDLAAQFAPVFYQEVAAELPQADYPTRFDLDGNWVAEDNVTFITSKASSVEPYVHFMVTETKSHFFIYYVLFYPYRYTVDEYNRFGNDTAGVTVVVRKSDSAPVVLETYFKASGDDERSFSFITNEAALIPGGESPYTYKFDEVYPQTTLFPNGHATVYISKQKHESCSWLKESNGFLDGCILNPGIKAGMQKIELVYKGGAVTPLPNSGGTFPTTASDVGFGLIHIMESWWPHRGEMDIGTAKMWAETYAYKPYTSTIFPNRPTLSGDLPSAFVDPVGNDNGRPIWAWKYNPQNGTSFYDMPRGVLTLDPAVHFKQRHDQGNKWADWNGTAGWSLDYCYNAYFNIDYRGLWPECSLKQ